VPVTVEPAELCASYQFWPCGHHIARSTIIPGMPGLGFVTRTFTETAVSASSASSLATYTVCRLSAGIV
jgi:hypothetical protein